MPILKHQKFIALLLFGWLSPTVTASTVAIPLLVNQCLNYSSDFHPDFSSVTALERQTIGLQNISDQLNYYRSFPLPNAAREALLQCQLTLADAVDRVLTAPQLPQLIAHMRQTDTPGLKQLAQKYQYLLEHQLPLEQKARLSTAQASIRQHLKSNNFQLAFGDCALPSKTPETTTQATPEQAPVQSKPLARNIASYLLQQPDEHCRYEVWRRYQTRVKDAVKPMLNKVLQQRQQQAQLAGVDNYADFLLQQQLVGSAKQLSIFLNAMASELPVAPWDIGLKLAELPSTEIDQISSEAFLKVSLSQLQQLGISHEYIDKHWLRLWYRNRLLGEILLSEAPKNRHLLIRRSVIGQQTGQSQLELKPQLQTLWDYQTAVTAVSEAVTQLAAGGRYYLDNGFALPQDAGRIGELWLEHFLSANFSHQLQPQIGSREQLAEDYRQHLALFQATVALALYQQPDTTPSAMIYRSLFAGEWPQSEDYAYSFSAIADTGPLVYAPIWQQIVAQAIYQTTRSCAPKQLFEELVINEDGNDIRPIMAQIWGADAVNRVMTQIHQGQFVADHRPSWCPLEHFTP
ncbi:M3 family metallopeptidase [Shewanella dokdonensis]|uniref:M3 family metallopeptidase n=1 Tax=Shewanella dokdonensis TaxID=712036 RepID=UPI00200D9260|nr:M3 family metallopeptidase [Shewanella dokdonensis]MCL1073070.1 M3 family metallopeptidase [Shewanella dokdonensis]